MTPTELQWVVNSYALIFGGFLLLGGRAGDLLGRKRLFLAGIVIFTGASLLNGLANSSEFLILARGLQGLGAALVSPAALSIVTTTFREGPERTKAMGVWSAIAAGGGAVGLLVGGIITDLFSWPWIFFVNIPVGIAAFALSLKYVPESKDEKTHRAFDIAGAVTVTAGLVALVYGIVMAAEKGWVSGHTLGFGLLAAVAPRLVRVDREPLGGAARAAPDLPDADDPVGQSRDADRGLRPLRDVLFQLSLRAARPGLLADPGGSCIRPLHARDRDRGGPLADAREEDRPALGGDHRDAARDGRDAALPPARRRRRLRHRPPARDRARLDRDGDDVRPRDPDRHERDRSRRRGPRLRASEHIATDRRRPGARDPLDPRDLEDDELAGERGRQRPGTRRRIPHRLPCGRGVPLLGRRVAGTDAETLGRRADRRRRRWRLSPPSATARRPGRCRARPRAGDRSSARRRR